MTPATHRSLVALLLAAHCPWLACLGTPVQDRCQNGILTGDSCLCSFPLVAVPVAGEGGNTSAMQCVIVDCGHGEFNSSAAECTCEAGWRRAGFTDPMNFLKTRCTQFMCTSDAECKEKLGIEEATCPEKGWNCDCGLRRAMYGTEEAQCMFLWYAVLMKLMRLFVVLMEVIWKAALCSAMLMLPLGKNIVGVADCYHLKLLMHDFAWSLFAIKVGIWLYLLCFAVYLVIGVLFASAFFMVLVLMLALTIVLFTCFAGADACDLCQGSWFRAAGGPLAWKGGRDCWPAGCRICGLEVPTKKEEAARLLQAHYFPDLFPFRDPRACECTCCHRAGCVPKCCRSCLSVVLLIPCFRVLPTLWPRVPENMLGGILGCLVGTHPLRNQYDPSSCIVEQLSMPCWSFTNRSEKWRRIVYSWLHEQDPLDAVRYLGVLVAEAESDEESDAERVVYRGVIVECEECTFDKGDLISNVKDYKRNVCWVCQEGQEEWDLWGACRHIFCSGCSTQMLRRSMPCPLCRVRSGRVQRRDRQDMSVPA